MTPETEEIQMHEEDGVRSSFIAETFSNGICAACNRLALNMRGISLTDEYSSGKTYHATFSICTGCLYRIAGQDDPRKEFFNGVVQDRPGAELE